MGDFERETMVTPMMKWMVRIYIGSTMVAIILLLAMSMASNWKTDVESGDFPKSINDGRWQMQYMGDGFYMIRSFEGKHLKSMHCEDVGSGIK